MMSKKEDIRFYEIDPKYIDYLKLPFYICVAHDRIIQIGISGVEHG